MNANDKTNDKAAGLLDPLEHLLGYQLRRAGFVTISSLVDSFAALGLNSTEAIVLRFVYANTGCTQSEIGRALGVKRTNMVPIVNGLMTKGLLERTPADGRSHSLYLTKAGGDLQRKIARISQKEEDYFFGDLPAETREIVMQVLLGVRAKGEQRE